MSGSVVTVLARLTGDSSGLVGAAARSEAAIGRLDKTAARSGGVAKFANVGKLALLGVAGVALGVSAVAIHMAGDFQESTTRLVTGAGEAESAIEGVRQGILDMAPAVGQMPNDLAKGMYLVESAGYHAADGLTVLKAAAEGAKVGGADMTVVADGLTTALTDYGFSAKDSAKVTSQLIVTVGQGKTTMGELAGSLHNVLPIASALHIKFADIMGAMATMTAQGIDAHQASTSLRFAMMALLKPTGAATKGLKAIGMSAGDVHKALAAGGLQGALEKITEAVGKKFPKGTLAYNAALAAAIGGTRGMTAALALTGPHMATYNANIKKIAGGTTEAGGHVKGFALTQEDLNSKIAAVKAGIGAMAVKLGNVLIPILLRVVSTVLKWGAWLGAHKPVLIAIAAVIGGVLVLAIAAYIGSTIAALAASVALAGGLGAVAAGVLAVTWPVLAVVAAIALLVFGLKYAWDHFSWFKTAVIAVWNALKAATSAVVAFFGAAWKRVAPVLKAAWTLIVDAFQIAWAIVSPILHAYFTVWSAVWDAMKPIFGFIGAAFGKVGEAVSKMWNNVVKPMFLLIVNAWMAVAGAIIHGAANAFGWVPGLGGKLQKAASDFDKFRGTVNKSLAGIEPPKPIHIPITVANVNIIPIKKGGVTIGVRGRQGGMQLFAQGGVARARRGGVPGILAEAGSDEAVLPLRASTYRGLAQGILSQMKGRKMGPTQHAAGPTKIINIAEGAVVVHAPNADGMTVAKVKGVVDDALTQLAREVMAS